MRPGVIPEGAVAGRGAKSQALSSSVCLSALSAWSIFRLHCPPVRGLCVPLLADVFLRLCLRVPLSES